MCMTCRNGIFRWKRYRFDGSWNDDVIIVFRHQTNGPLIAMLNTWFFDMLIICHKCETQTRIPLRKQDCGHVFKTYKIDMRMYAQIDSIVSLFL